MGMHVPTYQDYVYFSFPSTFATNAAYTLTAWIKRPATQSGADPAALFWGTTGPDRPFQTKVSGNKISHCNFTQFNWASSTSDITPGGSWYHVCLRRTSASNLDILVNGTNEASYTQDETALSGNDILRIGSNNQSTGGWEGDVTQVRLWTTNLSDGEVVTEKNSATVVKTAALYASWPLADGTDDSDESGNGRTLTLTGTPTTSADDPTQGGSGGAGLMWL